MNNNTSVDTRRRNRSLSTWIVSGLVILAAGAWLVRAIRVDSSRQERKYALPETDSPSEILSFMKRIHQGPNMESSQIGLTADAMQTAAEKIKSIPSASEQDIQTAEYYRLFYRTLALQFGIQNPNKETALEHSTDLISLIENADPLTDEHLMMVYACHAMLKESSVEERETVRLVEKMIIPFTERADASVASNAERFAVGMRSQSTLKGSEIELVSTNIDGEPFDLADLHSKVVFLEFWSTNCGPCVDEIPLLKKLHGKYQHQGFEIVGIPLDRYPGRVISFTQEADMPWTQLWDSRHGNERLSKQFGVFAIPFSILLDRDGKVVAMNLRAMSERKDKRLEEALGRLMRVESSS